MSTDIDIDLPDREKALDGLHYVAATQLRPTPGRHLTGVYFQDIPVDPLDGMAAFDYETASAQGYFKVDFLNNKLYDGVRDEAHLVALCVADPPWHRLLDPQVVAQLAHLHEHYHVVRTIAPRCMEDLMLCLALVRPGKKHLLGRNRDAIEREIWQPSQGYTFKRAHALAYAQALVVQINLLCEQGRI